MKPIPLHIAQSLAPRLVRDRVVEPNGCWRRTKYVHPKTGYTSIATRVGDKFEYYLAHRIAYVLEHGSIPDGLSIDHLCENRACINPAHLRAVEHRENVLRSRTNPFAINARKATCKHGHSFDGYTSSGARRCLTCMNLRKAEARERRKKAIPPERVHGTSAGYGYWCCRCEECRAWQRADYLRKKEAA